MGMLAWYKDIQYLGMSKDDFVSKDFSDNYLFKEIALKEILFFQGNVPFVSAFRASFLSLHLKCLFCYNERHHSWDIF